ncbi:MAG: hypothetical protein AAB590_01945 [Patescibacteria group bacterium]|mgnify:CR=1 FL=1
MIELTLFGRIFMLVVGAIIYPLILVETIAFLKASKPKLTHALVLSVVAVLISKLFTPLLPSSILLSYILLAAHFIGVPAGLRYLTKRSMTDAPVRAYVLGALVSVIVFVVIGAILLKILAPYIFKLV